MLKKPSGLKVVLVGQLIVNLPVVFAILAITALLIQLGISFTFALLVSIIPAWLLWSRLLENWKRWAIENGVERERLFDLGRLGFINFNREKIFIDKPGK